MSSAIILHICTLDKFIPPFIHFINSNFDDKKHYFILLGDINKHPVSPNHNVVYKNRICSNDLINRIYESDKIILHSLFNQHLVELLAIQPWILRKCYWVIWGGDLYQYQSRKNNFKLKIHEATRAFVIKRIGNIVTYIKGDFDLSKQWYEHNAKYHECLAYLSNLYQPIKSKKNQTKTINILAGNSADPTNNHSEIFKKLIPYKEMDIRIYCPLSYGPIRHAKETAELGNKLFGNKFIALQDFISFEEYTDLLNQIDIAIFAHNRQQAMGNSISLLGMGKKLFIKNNTSSWNTFTNKGITIFNFDDFNLSIIDPHVSKKNAGIIDREFSIENLTNQWASIFGDKK